MSRTPGARGLNFVLRVILIISAAITTAGSAAGGPRLGVGGLVEVWRRQEAPMQWICRAATIPGSLWAMPSGARPAGAAIAVEP